MTDGFIASFEKFMLEHVDTYPMWARDLAMATELTVVGNARFFTNIGQVLLNLNFLNIGASGLGKKTIPLKFCENLIRALGKAKRERFLLPSSSTTEGLHDYFLQVEVPNGEVENGIIQTDFVRNSGTIIKDEFSRLLCETSAKKYMAGILEFLSEMYDGTIRSRYTKTGKFQPQVDVCVSLVAASTPYLLRVLDEDFFRQGTGNRFLYAYSGAGKQVEKADPSEFFNPSFLSEYDEQTGEFVKSLLAYHENTKSLNIFVSDVSGKDLTDYEYMKKTEAQGMFYKDQLDIVYSYIDRLPLFVYKVAALKAIDRQVRKPEESIEIEEEDSDYAMKFVNEHFIDYRRIMDLWRSVRARRTTERRMSDLEVVLDIIVSSGGRIMKTDLIRKAASKGIDTQRLYEVVHMLLKGGKVVSEQVKDEHKTGKVPTYFCTAKDV